QGTTTMECVGRIHDNQTDLSDPRVRRFFFSSSTHAFSGHENKSNLKRIAFFLEREAKPLTPHSSASSSGIPFPVGVSSLPAGPSAGVVIAVRGWPGHK